MKRKHVIATFALSALMGIGVFAGVRANKVKEANAAGGTEETHPIYVAINTATVESASYSSFNLRVNCNVGDGGTWKQTTLVKTTDTTTFENKTVFSGVYTERWGGVDVMQIQIYDGNTWKEQKVPFGSWTTMDKIKTLYKYEEGTWVDSYTPPAPAAKYNVDVYINGVKHTEEITEGNLPANPEVNFGQVFSGWYDNAEMTEGHEVHAITSNAPVYCAVTTLPTVTYNLNLADAPEAISANPYLYAYEGGVSNAAWPGVALEGNTFTVPNDAVVIITNQAGDAQTVNITQSGVANDTLTVLSTKTGDNYNAVWESEKCSATLSVKFDADVPEYADIYIPGAFNGWSDDVTVSKMTRVSDTEFTYALTDIMPGSYQYKIVADYAGVTKMGWDYQITAENQTLEFAAEDDGKTLDLGTKTYDFATNMPEPVVPPAEDGYYIVGTESEWKYEGATKMDAGDDGDLAKLINYQAKANEEFKIRGYHDGVDTWYQWGQAEEGHENENYEVGETAKALDIFLNAYGQYFVFDHVEPDIPAEEGYYICGLDGWRYENAAKMVAPSTVPGNVAHYMGLEAEVDDEIRVRSYYDDRTPKDQWALCGNGEETYGEVTEENNFKFTKAGTYDVYAYYIGDTFKYSVAEHVDSYTVEMTGVNFNGKAAAGTVALADQTAYSSANFNPDLPEQNGYVARGVYEDEACTTAYTPKVFDAAGHLYVKYTKIGVYMVGDDTFSGADLGWTVDGATILPAAINDTENNLYEGTITITGASVQNPVEVRPANYTSEGELDYSMEYSLGVAYDFAKKVGNNIQFTENGTFAVYFNKSNQIYLNKGADAFYTKFLTEVGGICDPDGDTNLTNLASVWVAQEDAFNSLSKTERDAIIAVGFNGGDESGDDLHKVIAKYHYILTKYGTAVLNDFIFGQDNIEANVNTIGMTADDTTMTVVVISAIAVISAAGLFFLIRRKRRLVK